MDTQHDDLCQAVLTVHACLTDIQFRAYIAVLGADNPIGKASIAAIESLPLGSISEEVLHFAAALSGLDRIMADPDLRDRLMALHDEPVFVGDVWGNSYTEALWRHAIGVWTDINGVAGRGGHPWVVATDGIEASSIDKYWPVIALRIRMRREIDAELTVRLLERELVLLRNSADSKADNAKRAANPKGKPGPKPDKHAARNTRIVKAIDDGKLPIDVARDFKLGKSTVSEIYSKAKKDGG